MKRLNCWEYMKCGREEGGARANDMGVCRASTEKGTNGVHGGKNGGRACWAITGTLCDGKVQGSFAFKLAICSDCAFYNRVVLEEGDDLMFSGDILKKIHFYGGTA